MPAIATRRDNRSCFMVDLIKVLNVTYYMKAFLSRNCGYFQLNSLIKYFASWDDSLKLRGDGGLHTVKAFCRCGDAELPALIAAGLADSLLVG